MKPIERRNVSDEPVQLADPAMQKACPRLWEFITHRKWDDGRDRVPGSMLVFEGDGVIKIMLNDKDAGLTLWIATRTLSDVFKAAEAGLNNPDADWRLDRKKTGDQASRKKAGR